MELDGHLCLRYSKGQRVLSPQVSFVFADTLALRVEHEDPSLSPLVVQTQQEQIEARLAHPRTV